jgi:hypothetical protein
MGVLPNVSGAKKLFRAILINEQLSILKFVMAFGLFPIPNLDPSIEAESTTFSDIVNGKAGTDLDLKAAVTDYFLGMLRGMEGMYGHEDDITAILVELSLNSKTGQLIPLPFIYSAFVGSYFKHAAPNFFSIFLNAIIIRVNSHNVGKIPIQKLRSDIKDRRDEETVVTRLSDLALTSEGYWSQFYSIGPYLFKQWKYLPAFGVLTPPAILPLSDKRRLLCSFKFGDRKHESLPVQVRLEHLVQESRCLNEEYQRNPVLIEESIDRLDQCETQCIRSASNLISKVKMCRLVSRSKVSAAQSDRVENMVLLSDQLPQTIFATRDAAIPLSQETIDNYPLLLEMNRAFLANPSLKQKVSEVIGLTCNDNKTLQQTAAQGAPSQIVAAEGHDNAVSFPHPLPGVRGVSVSESESNGSRTSESGGEEGSDLIATGEENLEALSLLGELEEASVEVELDLESL